MTNEQELQELRKENRRLFNRNKHLEELRQQDLAQITLLRRQIEFLQQKAEAANG